MRHVFLSYARDDEDQMHAVRQLLQEAGLKTWTSELILPGTTSWNFATPKAVREAACVLVLVTASAPEEAWIVLELNYAQKHATPVFTALLEGEPEMARGLVLTAAGHFDLRPGDQHAAQRQALLDAIFRLIEVG